MRLILASQSPRRKQLLAEMGYPFTVESPEVEEWEDAGADAEELVLCNAGRKAEAAAARAPDALILAADTTVWIEGLILGKPRDREEAAGMLRRLSGRTHSVFSGITLLHLREGRRHGEAVCSRVTFRVLDEAVIEAYFARVDPLDKAGAYGIQEARELIIESVEGSVSNVMGLPLEQTKAALERFLGRETG